MAELNAENFNNDKKNDTPKKTEYSPKAAANNYLNFNDRLNAYKAGKTWDLNSEYKAFIGKPKFGTTTNYRQHN